MRSSSDHKLLTLPDRSLNPDNSWVHTLQPTSVSEPTSLLSNVLWHKKECLMSEPETTPALPADAVILLPVRSTVLFPGMVLPLTE